MRIDKKQVELMILLMNKVTSKLDLWQKKNESKTQHMTMTLHDMGLRRVRTQCLEFFFS